MISVKLIGEKGVIVWDQSKSYVKIFNPGDKKWKKEPVEEGTIEEGYVTGEKMYIAERRHFIKATKSEIEHMRNFTDEKKMLEILHKAERSFEKGVHVKLGANCED